MYRQEKHKSLASQRILKKYNPQSYQDAEHNYHFRKFPPAPIQSISDPIPAQKKLPFQLFSTTD